ncbi:MAG: glutaminyl-peptide cyclotransferase [Polyangiaceae bacterium]|nr:glutaminyl-peptide cyclotransferase [Polyangiaceae bacterium]
MRVRLVSYLSLSAALFGLSPAAVCAQGATLPTVVRSFPHDRTAFTQGLLVFEGKLFESTGLEGRSTLQRSDIATGRIEKKVDLDPAFFGEGLARINRNLYQLTWKNGVAIRYNLDTFVEQGRFNYAGEGWGLCYDGQFLVMSNGTDRLSFRDPETFGEVRSLQVLRGGQPLFNINELECVQGLIYANVWQTDVIVGIDARTGKVASEINAAGLLAADERDGVDVLNGIAVIPETGNFYITGKYWPKLFEVTFSGAPKPVAAPAPIANAPPKVPPQSKPACAVRVGQSRGTSRISFTLVGLVIGLGVFRRRARATLK